MSLGQQSLKIAQDLKSPPLTISPQFTLGDIYGDLGDYKKSREFYQQALTTAQQLKNRNSEGIALFAQAMAEAQAFLTFARKTQNSLWEKDALNLLGDLHKKFGRKEQAVVAYQQALAITTNSQVTGADAGIYAGLADIYQASNQPNSAIAYYSNPK
ncbi:tetratricopeptide repeat protein [Aetokthonos hydrillicola Thurmond2011]|uniref:Tetratricopeptide repeat protein n=1 Tax=Aetokthonos hydrillicola Thurmond2011 TaxID=2712845 RepID=A0AAP5IC40_9CYAN|nr:tetratricopeptide repeat protein [Aetokthonos hydrillicola]MBO3463715.1 tetratricopeptide repeat protein [Aetokthonos hydrillicola CCALA 1050]MBW4587007.1 tetratricopeptide repeat protein [Aetokthonos hydrillicola CCALA 1050]MDR9897519.1 tetratricopeptide repeat protein [Aetokthonos hydrillicola Thurmond2011]